MAEKTIEGSQPNCNRLTINQLQNHQNISILKQNHQNMYKPTFINAEFGGKVLRTFLWVFLCIIPTYQLAMNNDPQHHWLRCMDLLLYVSIIACTWIPFVKNYTWVCLGYAVVVLILDVLCVMGIV